MKKTIIVLLLTVAAWPLSADAGARRFTYSYEATTTAPGAFEIENWVTWQTHQPADHGFNQVDFRHEIEFGLTNHLQMGVYLADWNHQDSGFNYAGSAIELIYGLTNPATDWLGLALYQEIRAANRDFELESKVIAQKDLGRVVLVYNATLESKWEGRELAERAGEFAQSFGASYEMTPRLLFGAELLHEIALPDWTRGNNGMVFGGPNVSYRIGRWWATMTALAQLTRVQDEPDLQVRTIFGYTF